MKVFLNLLAASTGGQISRASAFLDRFEEFDKDSELIIIKEKSVVIEHISSKKFLIIDIPLYKGKLKIIQKIIWENFFMPRLIKKLNADVYLTFSHYLPNVIKIPIPSVVGVSNLAPFSKVAREHESWFNKIRLMVLKKTIISSARRANCVLALSHTCKKILQQHGVKSEKIKVTPNGVDTYWSQVSKDPNILKSLEINKQYILYVSHFYYYKNHERLIKAYHRLLSSNVIKRQLVLVGKPHDIGCYKKIKKLVKKLNLVNKVIIVPGENKRNLKELYQQTSLFIFPSLIENCPNILLEAMMSGASIVTSNLDPMPEFCGDAAVYFNATDIVDISKTIEVILKDEEQLKILSHEAEKQAKKYSWDDFVLKVVKYIAIVSSEKILEN